MVARAGIITTTVSGQTLNSPPEKFPIFKSQTRGRSYNPLLAVVNNELFLTDEAISFVPRLIPQENYLPNMENFLDIDIGVSQTIVEDVGQLLATIPNWYRLSLDFDTKELFLKKITWPLGGLGGN